MNLENFILENFTLKRNVFARAITTTRMWCNFSELSTFHQISCCVEKFWLFIGTSKLRTRQTISYQILVVLSLVLYLHQKSRTCTHVQLRLPLLFAHCEVTGVVHID